MTSLKDQLTIVTVSYNSGEVIGKYLGSLIKEEPCPIIVVDNDSSDGSVDSIQKEFPQATIIKKEKNVGYGRAANSGFRVVKTPWILLINPDVQLDLKSLHRVFNQAKSYDEEFAIFSPAVSKKDHIEKGDVEVDYLIGAFLLLRTSALDKVGYFDENIFLYYEEKDLEYRFLNAGYKLILQSDIYVKHEKASSTVSSDDLTYLRNWHVAWSKIYFSEKHRISSSPFFVFRELFFYGFKSLIYLGAKRIKYRARFSGALAYLLGKKAFIGDVQYLSANE